MAEGKRIYSIEIRGLKDSSEQVDLLLAKLNELDGKLKDIGKGNVKISFGGGTKKIKDDVDETSNTIAGLRKQLSTLKKELINTDLGSDKFDDLRKKTLDLNNHVKEIEMSYGTFNRNIGNYTKSFIAAFAQFPQAVQDSIKNLNGFNDNANTLRTQLKSCKDAMDELTASGQQNSEAYNALKSVYAELADEQDKFNNELKNATDNTKGLTYTVSLFQELADAYTIATAASQLFGKSNDDVVKGIAKLQQLQAIANSLKNIQSSFQNGGKAVQIWNTAMKGSDKVLKALKISTQAEAAAQGTLSTATLVSANAMKILRVAIASTGIGLLVVAIGSLIGWMSSLESESEKVSRAFENIKTSTDRALAAIDTKRDLGIISALDAAEQKLEEYENQARQVFRNVDKSIKSDTHNNWFTKMFGGRLGGITDELGESFNRWQKSLTTSLKTVEDVEKALQQADKWAVWLQRDGASQIWVDRLEQTRDVILDIKNGLVDVQKESKNVANEISQMNIDSMADGYSKQLAQLNENYRKEQEHYKGNKEALIALEKKYQRDLTNLNREWGNKRLEVERQIASNELAAQKNNLAIRIKQIELERQREIDVARNSGIKVNEQIASINAKYDKQKEDEVKEYNSRIEKLHNDSYLRIKAIAINTEQELIKRFENAHDEIISFKWNDIIKDSDVEENVRRVSEVFDAWDDIIVKKDPKKQTLTQYQALTKSIAEIRSAERQNDIQYYQELKESYQNYYDLRAKEITLSLQLEYNEKKEQIQKDYGITEEGNQMLLDLENEYHDKELLEQTKLGNEYKAKERDLANSVEKIHMQKYSDLLDMQKSYDMVYKERMLNSYFYNSWGLFDLTSAKAQNEMMAQIYSEMIEDIDSSIAQLRADLEGGLITAEDYAATKENLLKMKLDLSNTRQDIELDGKELIGKYVESINQYVQVGIQGFSEITNSVFDVIQFNLDKQMEALEEENDRLQKLLDKQEDMISRHNDNINNIEGELGSARGDRRDQLIAALNAEKLAREQAYQEQKKLEKEKEKNERKQKELEKKQRKEQWKNQVMQAIASSALATANGLATQPFMPVGIAMGALATTLGAVQIALLRKQKPYKNGGSLPTKYADGGVIKGKSHAQGGVPIVGLSRPVEVEGQEFITNKMTTQLNLPLLEFINKQKHRININDLVEFYGGATSRRHSLVKTHFAEGGQLPTMDTSNFARNLTKDVYITDDRPIVVSVQEITDTQSRMARVRELANV